MVRPNLREAPVIRLMNDFILVRPLVQTVSAGGILLIPREGWSLGQDDQQEKVGVVMSVGPGKRMKKKPGLRDSMWDIEPGQKIAYSPNGVQTKDIDGEELHVIRRDSIFGLVEEEHAAS